MAFSDNFFKKIEKNSNPLSDYITLSNDEDGADWGTYYLTGEKCEIINTNYIEGYSPINIIKKENISKKLYSAKFYYGCFGLTGEELFVDVTENSDTYSFVDANDDRIEYMNVICNQKCYVYENGETFIENQDSFDIKLKYDDGEVKKYSFINKIKNKEKFISLVNNIGYKVVIIGKGTEENYNELLELCKGHEIYILNIDENIKGAVLEVLI